MKHYFKHLCLFVVIAIAGNNIFSQDVPHSVGPAPESSINQAPLTGNFDFQVGSRYFSQRSTTPTFQFGKSFLETCTITNIGSAFPITFPGGLVNKGGTIYTWNQSSPFQLWRVDTVTGTHTLVFNMTGVPQTNFTGMTWDGTTMYGVSTSITVSQIFTINMTTGACTPIGSPTGVCAGAIFLAGRLGANYSLFSVDIVADNLYKWNKGTGVATLVGSIAGNSNFGQDAQFDSRDGKLYWFAYLVGPGPGLRSIDTATGSNTQLCTWGTDQGTGIAVTEPVTGPITCNYTWAAQVSGTTANFFSVKAVNDLVCWAVAAGGVIRKTTNGGTNWVDGDPNNGITADIYNVEAIDANTAWCTTSPGATFIYKTTNGGTNWVQVYTLAAAFINAIKMVSATNGYAFGDPVGGNWLLLRTTDGGTTWTNLATVAGTGDGRNNCVQVALPNMWFGTGQGPIWRSTNSGINWSSAPSGITTQILGIQFNSATTGLAGGASMRKSTDGGATWSALTVLGTGNIVGIQGVGTDYWYGRGTGIFRTTNDGTSWTQVHTAVGTQADLSLATGSNGCLVAWCVASGGNIAKMTGQPVGITSNNNEIPNLYKLEQNYPNPFNPTTTIKFSVPKAGNVELIVYDLLGKEVSVLVNEYVNVGNYSVDFDASSLASGVYFYAMKSGDFVETKKMALIK